ncbi:serine hydrolase [Streptococcus iniae]|uniref:serine hydrolase domain-containing protein n=2 Tax=Streptococcus iniae TaxID=1346 RepID=UPI0009C03489|nr:serine hydrolase domain-containing protein [Streptococcus iniae]AYB01630.1 class A beta-lactamase-related serine hydrolase [Streptococcus iniae]AYB03493.1 class A beta-lactamase-related serine hydrolase [Streptococcus iniae]RLU31135.1 serine hydrolase [Streptococcus iniae]RLU35266.1 serine hydrolase [Streptococcus iniae]RLU36099.1 serine hydrolase [Streptococcus iniae]
MVYEMTLPLFDLIEDQLSENIYPGASLALFQRGQWQEYYFGTVDGQKPTQSGLFYDLASVSKVVGVGTLCIFLVNSGALELDFPLQHYYPDFQNSQVTLRQLLTHTSGLDPYIPNRNQLNAKELKEAMNVLEVKDDKGFHYTDVNFILLGFMLEKFLGKDLNVLLKDLVFDPFGMDKTAFGPCQDAVPTLKGCLDGNVHDPKAKVLGSHAGSAGLFSTLEDMEKFLTHYMSDGFSRDLFDDYSHQEASRSMAWRLTGNWLDHTGYTGPFIMVNNKQEAAIFLTNRTYDKDDRSYWIEKRDALMESIKDYFKD